MIQYLLQLMMTRGIGDRALKKILHYVESTGHSLRFICESPEIISSILGQNRKTWELINNVANCSTAAKELSVHLLKNDIKVITEIEESYPVFLKESLQNDCPPVLFVKGNEKLLSDVSVGFCGSRKVSERGQHITEQCAAQLAEQDIIVVSGYAAGTDLAAHASAIRNNGKTIFVLAEGILNYTIKGQVKPYLNDKNHLFVSQFFPTAQWNVGNAMKRNEIIIGLSKAMILVESGRSGGTFAAGEETLRRKKPLFVIDFEKPAVSAEANPYFISRGGNPIRGINGVPSLARVFLAVNENNTHLAPEQLGIDTLICT